MSKKEKLGVRALSRIQICGLILILVLPSVTLLMFLRSRGSISLITGVCGSLLMLQLVTFFQLKRDKHMAQIGKWRVPEFRLHSLELLGGWPSSFVAQRRYKHKISKKSYQCIFWLVVLLYQLLALDCLLDGSLTQYLKYRTQR